MIVIIILGTLGAVLLSPWLAGKVMGLKGGIGKSVLVALVSIGLMQIVGMIASHMGPLGEILGLMGGLAAWFQVVKIVHGTDTASTAVFMFWQLFFQILITSLLMLLVGDSVLWVLGLSG